MEELSEFELQKGVAHAFSLSGEVELIPKSGEENHPLHGFRLEGGHFERWTAHMAAALPKEETLLKGALRSAGRWRRSSQELIEEHRRSGLLLFRTGFVGHCAIILIVGDRLLLCNRGAASRRAVEAYRFNPASLTPELLDKMQNCSDKAEYRQTLFQLAPKLLSFSKSEELIEPSLPDQSVGNCTWASLEAAICGYFYQIDPSSAKERFDAFSNQVRTNLFNRFLSTSIQSHYKLNRDLATRAAEQMGGWASWKVSWVNALASSHQLFV